MTKFADDHFYSLVSKEFTDAMEQMAPAVCELSEPELKSMVKPTPLDYALKTSFWREYQKADSTGGMVTTRDVYGGIATPNYFRNHILKNQFKLAWLCRPTQVYEKEVEALLTRGTERLWEIMDMDIHDDDGRIDVKRGQLVLETIRMVEQRAKGLAVQRVQSVNLNIESQKPKVLVTNNDDIDKRIAELESELKRLPKPKESIDVEVQREDEEGILEATGAKETATGDVASPLRA
jgi:hypothetical protein